MANMPANFDEVAHSGLVSIMFTSILPYMSIVTLTFDLQNQYGSVNHPLTMANMSAKFDEKAHNG